MTLVFPVGSRINIATAHDTSMPGQRQAQRIPLVAIATVKAWQKGPPPKLAQRRCDHTDRNQGVPDHQKRATPNSAQLN